MRTNGFSTSTFFALALTIALAVLSLSTPAVAQTIPVANGYQFNFLSYAALSEFVPTDGFPGFCANSFSGGGTQAVGLLQFNGSAFNIFEARSFAGLGSSLVFKSFRGNIDRGSVACGLNNLLFFTFASGKNEPPTLWSLRLGDQPIPQNLTAIATPGQPFNYAGGSATYLDGYAVAANYGRVIVVGKFDQGSGSRTLVFAIFANTAPRLLADLGTEQAIAATITAANVYTTLISDDHSSKRVVAIPSNGQSFEVARLDGVTFDDLTGPYGGNEINVNVNRTAAAIAIRQGNHLVIQTLRDGQTTPITILDTNQVEQYPVSRTNSIALTENGDIYFVMTTIVDGGQESIFRLDPRNITRIMTEGIDVRRVPATGWTVATVSNRVVASNWFATYEILPPR